MKIKSKPTKDCFKDFWYRDSDFDNLLPKTQPAQEGEITVLTPGKEMTFLEMAQEFLGTQDPEKIKKYCLTLPMVEEIIATRENELETTGYANFFFVENKDGGVSVAGVFRRGVGRPWDARVDELADVYRWYADDRLVVCNLETRPLGTSDPVSDLPKTLIINGVKYVKE